MKTYYFIIAVFLLFTSNFSAPTKKEPKLSKPSAMSDELFCVGCVAFAVETVKILKGKKGESDVDQAIQKVCNEEYTTYCI
jgi:hypothetical protein